MKYFHNKYILGFRKHSLRLKRINWAKLENMSLECPLNPVYRTSVEQKRHSKSAAKIYRYGSPKIRDQLRDKCRKRMHEVRQAHFSRRRLADITEEIDLDKLMREELASLESDLRLQEEIYKELRDEMNDWLVQELEAEEACLIDAAYEDSNDIPVICPICEQNNLSATFPNEPQGNIACFSCKCGVSFNYLAKPMELRETLHSQIDIHEQKCEAKLTFYLEPQSVRNDGEIQTAGAGVNNLCAICEKFGNPAHSATGAATARRTPLIGGGARPKTQ